MKANQSLKTILHELNYNKSFGFVLGILLIALISGILIALELYLAVGLFVILLVIGLSVKNINLAIFLFYLSVFVPFGYIDRYFLPLPAYMRWFPHFFLGLSLILLFLQKKNAVTGIQSVLPKPLIRIGVSYLLLVFFSVLINFSSFIAAIWSLRSMSLIYGSIILHRIHFSKLEQENLVKYLEIIGLIMIPLTIFQRTVIVPSRPIQQNVADMVTGLFTSYAELVFYQLFCIMGVISWWLHGKKILPLSPVFWTIFLFFPLIISYSKAAPLYFFLSMIFVFWLCRKRISLKFILVLLVLVVIGVSGTFLFDRIFQTSNASYSVIEKLYNLEGALDYLLSDTATQAGGLQRGAALVFNYKLLQNEPHGLILGLGPGSFSDSRLPGATGYIYKAFPALDLNYTSLTTLLGELGITGVIITIFLLFSIYRLGNPDEERYVIVLRRGTLFLLACLLFYGPYLLFPSTALLIGILSIQDD